MGVRSQLIIPDTIIPSTGMLERAGARPSWTGISKHTVRAVVRTEGNPLIPILRQADQAPVEWELPGGRVEKTGRWKKQETLGERVLKEVEEELSVKGTIIGHIVSMTYTSKSGMRAAIDIFEVLVPYGSAFSISAEHTALTMVDRTRSRRFNIEPKSRFALDVHWERQARL